MQDLSDDILVKIAYNMEPDFIEPGAKLFNSDQDIKDMVLGEMIIVYSGVIYSYVTVDESTELVLDYLGRGSVLRANHFLVKKKHFYNVGVLQNMHYYYMSYERLWTLAVNEQRMGKEAG